MYMAGWTGGQMYKSLDKYLFLKYIIMNNSAIDSKQTEIKNGKNVKMEIPNP